MGTVDELVVVGARIEVLRSAPKPEAIVDPRFDRQAHLFGDAGQRILSGCTVAVVGVGGMGMLIVEYLARLGVGRLILIDPDRVEQSNLPRLPGARN